MVFIDIVDPASIVNLLALIIAAAAVPLALTLRCTSTCLAIQRWVPLILTLTLLGLITALTGVFLFGVDIHHYLELAMVGAVVAFSFTFIAEMRRRR